MPPGARVRSWESRLRHVAAILASSALIAGCAGYASFRQGQAQIAEGDIVGGVEKLAQAMRESPQNSEFRRSYFIQRDRSIASLLRDALAMGEAGQYEQAKAIVAQVSQLDPTNERARDASTRIDTMRRHVEALNGIDRDVREGRLAIARERAEALLLEDRTNPRTRAVLRQIGRAQSESRPTNALLEPRMRAAFSKTVSLGFTNASILQVFESIRLASGLNFIFDRDAKLDNRITVQVTNKTVEDALTTLLTAAQLTRKVLDADTLLIYPNTPQKAREHKDLVVRSFYLSNADLQRAANLVRTIAKARDVFVDERLGLIVVRDHAEIVSLAARLLAGQDLADPEVMLDLEVLEVSASRLTELGIRWPDSISASAVGSAGTAGRLTLQEFRNRDSSLVRLNLPDPLVAAQLRAQRGDTDLLANPRIRVRNRQSARILIGERVPVITTNSIANVGTSESVTYLDVGLKLEIEPTISIDDDVGMKVSLEVSNILETITRGTGTQAYRLGTRNAVTTLRVHDNETQILAGLIQRDDRHSNTGLPGLNEIPLLNRLFGASSTNDVRTEIVLLITPRIVRNIEAPAQSLMEYSVGPEASQTVQAGTVPNAPMVGAGPGGIPPSVLGGVSVAPAPSSTGQSFGARPVQPSPGMGTIQSIPLGGSGPGR